MNTLKPFFTFSHSSCMYSLREDALHFSKHWTLFFQSFEPSLFWKCKRPCCILFKQAKKETTALSSHSFKHLFKQGSHMASKQHHSRKVRKHEDSHARCASMRTLTQGAQAWGLSRKVRKHENSLRTLFKQARKNAHYFLFMRLSFLSPHTHGSMQHTFIACECSMLKPSSMKEALIFLSNKNAQKMLPSLLEESFKRVQFLSSYFSSSTFFTY